MAGPPPPLGTSAVVSSPVSADVLRSFLKQATRVRADIENWGNPIVMGLGFGYVSGGWSTGPKRRDTKFQKFPCRLIEQRVIFNFRKTVRSALRKTGWRRQRGQVLL
jgi:hypothetical protein